MKKDKMILKLIRYRELREKESNQIKIRYYNIKIDRLNNKLYYLCDCLELVDLKKAGVFEVVD